jgi:H/ACA ribonucleoprotein complex subunit 4
LRDAVTDPNYGKNPEKRTLEERFQLGIVNLDKPAGPTSHEVVAMLKRILRLPKAGHRGTLDPGVTGVLPIALNKGTKVLDALLLGTKTYVTNMRLHDDVPEESLQKVLSEFTDLIYQTPPLKSSVKKILRKRRIHHIELLEQNGKNVLFVVEAQSGTYIRTLCVDIGRALGVGAHMQELRRIVSGPFSERRDLVTLQDLVEGVILKRDYDDNEKLLRSIQPIERAVELAPKVWVSDGAVDPVCNGSPLAVPGIVKMTNNIQKNGLVAIMSLKEELIALGIAQMSSSQISHAEKGIAVLARSVLMERGTYPRLKK